VTVLGTSVTIGVVFVPETTLRIYVYLLFAPQVVFAASVLSVTEYCAGLRPVVKVGMPVLAESMNAVHGIVIVLVTYVLTRAVLGVRVKVMLV